jgi:hypothetical protein
MRVHFIVTNIDKTTQRVKDWQGQMKFIEPGKSILMHNPPKESYTFHVEPLTHEAEKIYFEEFKNEGSELITVAEKKKLNTKEVKK